MNDILNKPTVLVLNRHWQAIHVKTPAEAFCMMASDAATSLDITDGNFLPTKWSDWLRSVPVATACSATRWAGAWRSAFWRATHSASGTP